MRLRRLLAGLLACLMLVPVLAGCSDGSDTEAPRLPGLSEMSSYNLIAFVSVNHGMTKMLAEFDASGTYPGITESADGNTLNMRNAQITTTIDGDTFDVTIINGTLVRVDNGDVYVCDAVFTGKSNNASMGDFFVNCRYKNTVETATGKSTITRLIVNGVEYDPYR